MFAGMSGQFSAVCGRVLEGDFHGGKCLRGMSGRNYPGCVSRITNHHDTASPRVAVAI